MKDGNILILSLIIVCMCLIIIMFFAIIFMSHINSILYNYKIEMYSINRSAVISVNKNSTSMGKFSYNKNEYKKQFEKLLKESFELNDKFENEKNLIEKVDIVEYKILEAGERDSFNKSKVDNRVIHTVIRMKIKPIILKDLFEDIFTFTIHEDVNLNEAY